MFQGPNGRYWYNRMPFSIASDPEKYQWQQHEFLDGLHGVINIADDIFVYECGNTKEDADIDHDQNLLQLLEKCAEHDLRRSVRNLQFKSPSFTLMGQKLTHKGAEPDPVKVAAIREMLVPTDKASVHCFLGVYHCLSKFFHNLFETVLPFRNLAEDDSAFLWSESHETAFKKYRRLNNRAPLS